MLSANQAQGRRPIDFDAQISYRRVHSTGRDGQLKVFDLKSDHSNHLCLPYYQAFVERLTKSES